MKTPIQMLEVFVSDIIETLFFWRRSIKKVTRITKQIVSINSLIRSMQKTVDNMNGYIKSHINSVKPCIPVAARNDLADDIFDVILTAKKLEALAQTYSESFLLTRTMTTPRAICQL
ncbi:Uncharacterised protein [Klebsiella pneumoniae]|uniref:Uncharacterized protein n=1 Tax=Klebsiella pneumoniae TaxID=573 RepID=A0A377TG52_KLEPN|nr:Uncharacterised protein [Klebsiella pneumoniae]